jgi:putative spermidine/putrescine transport system permease protein
MAQQAATTPLAAPLPATSERTFSWHWVGLVPFVLFAVAFIFLPSANLFLGAFRTPQGEFTLQHLRDLSQPFILDAYWLSIRISLVTAVGGAFFGFLLAYASILGGLPPFVRSALATFSGVASNFAGVPLSFAFVATLGRVGMVTVFLREVLGLDLYRGGFSLYSFLGLSLTYMYFQFPLMVLVISPALDGLKREWREAANNLGASSWQYWRYVALPILLPSLLGATILLFGNAFGAYATAASLTGGSLNLVTVLIGAQIRGDVLHNPGLGYALALGMVVVMAITLVAYTWLRQRTSRWLREG